MQRESVTSNDEEGILAVPMPRDMDDGKLSAPMYLNEYTLPTPLHQKETCTFDKNTCYVL